MTQLDMFGPSDGKGKTSAVEFPKSKDADVFLWTKGHENTSIASRKRDEGIRRVSENNIEFLETMRGVARMICREKGWVCSDDLRAWADAHRLSPTHYNAWGAILTKKEFVPGEYIVSKQPQGHANRVRRWVLRKAA